jgi:hypothetical protein
VGGNLVLLTVDGRGLASFDDNQKMESSATQLVSVTGAKNLWNCKKTGIKTLTRYQGCDIT